MAFIQADKDKQLQEQQPGQDPMGGSSTPANAQSAMGPQGAMGVGQGSSGNIVSSGNAAGASTAGVNAGGGGWTNIQSYMDANKGTTGSADMLNERVGSQFETEKKNLTESAGRVKTEAEKAAAPLSEAQKNASNWVSEAGQGYDWGGSHNKAYTDNFQKLNDALHSEWKGPREFTYNLDNRTQTYGQNLKDPGAFNDFMGDMYSQRAGAPITRGGRNLQTQLDVSNVALGDSRQRLLEQYSGLGSLRDQTVTDTTKALANAEEGFRTNQNTLKDYLGNKANTLDTTIAQQEADARNAFQKDFTSGRSGRSSAAVDALGAGPTDRRFGWQEKDAGVWGNDLTFEGLQRHEDFYRPRVNQLGGGWDYSAAADANRDVLNNFYSQQDAKFANTADAEERQWNMLQDLLKTGNQKKQQGFKVRG